MYSKYYIFLYYFAISFIKGGHSLKVKSLHIHLYLIATKYLWDNALVECLDNWTRSYSLVVIYRNCEKQIFNGSVIKDYKYLLAI